MSAMMEAIDRIAVYAERQAIATRLDTLTFQWMLNNGYDLEGKKTKEIRDLRKNLNAETLQEIVANSYPPRLSLEQIKEITKDYPFYLSAEMCDLYQRGNGCLPIGLDNPSKDWNSFDNYIDFPDFEKPLLALEDAMSMYRNWVKWREKYRYKIDPHWFPISCFEDWILAVVGSEERQETSPVISFYDSDFRPNFEWQSLTNMLLSWVEIRERGLNYPNDESEINAIHQKYGREAGRPFW